MPYKPVPVDPVIANSLLIGSGIFWTITYLLILRRGVLDKTHGMPMVALCANLSWEFIFAFIFPHPYPQRIINFIWLAFDVGIMAQYLYYGKNKFMENLPKPFFYFNFLLGLLLAIFLISFLSVEFEEYVGYYAAFGQNLLMSLLFISMLIKRNSAVGQSMYIGLFKMVGTISASIIFYLYFPKSYLLLLLFFAILFYDVIYLWLLSKKLVAEGIKPWRRF